MTTSGAGLEYRRRHRHDPGGFWDCHYFGWGDPDSSRDQWWHRVFGDTKLVRGRRRRVGAAPHSRHVRRRDPIRYRDGRRLRLYQSPIGGCLGNFVANNQTVL